MPLYKQLFEVIEQQISDGELKEGQQLMTEAELSAEYGVSRITVRKALELLVEDGILVKRQGVGAFVAERKMHRRVEGIMGFTQNCAAEGKRPVLYCWPPSWQSRRSRISRISKSNPTRR